MVVRSIAGSQDSDQRKKISKKKKKDKAYFCTVVRPMFIAKVLPNPPPPQKKAYFCAVVRPKFITQILPNSHKKGVFLYSRKANVHYPGTT